MNMTRHEIIEEIRQHILGDDTHTQAEILEMLKVLEEDA